MGAHWRQLLAGGTLVVLVGLSTRSAAQAPTVTPGEPAALRNGETSARPIEPKSKLARIWANEPPLVRLARDRFGEALTETDAKFFAAVAANDWADFRPSPDAVFDATDPASWAEAPVLNADRIAWLCSDQAAARLVPSRGIWLNGAKIEGKIDLYRCDVPFSLTLYNCLLTGGISLEHGKVQEVDVRNSCSAELMAQGVQVMENMYLNNTCVYGGLNFIDAHVAGDFDFTGGRANHGMPGDDPSEPGISLNLHDAKIGGDLRLADRFHAAGLVRLLGTQIGRSLICTAGRFHGAGQVAVDAQRCQIGASVLLGGGFRADGGVDLRRSHIGGDLDCDGGRFVAADVDALNADLVHVGGQVHLGDGFHAEGEVRLISATIAGDVDCDNGHFLHPDGDALSLDSTEIGRSLRIGVDGASPCEDDPDLPAGFLARGTVRLWGTKIDQDVLATGGRFETPRGSALLACNIRVANRVVLVAVECLGTVNLFAATIGRELDCRGSRFDGRQTDERIALLANGIQVRGHFYCNALPSGDRTYPFHADGMVSVQFATIGMHWDLHGARITNAGSDALEASDSRVGGYVNLDRVAIDGRASFSRAKIDGMWILLHTVEPQRMRLDLRFAHIWVIKDERLDDWPPAGQLQLEGLVYDHFDDDSPLGVDDRLAWLRRQYSPINSDNDQAAIGVDAPTQSTARRYPRSTITGGQFADRSASARRVTPASYQADSGSSARATMPAPSAPIHSSVVTTDRDADNSGVPPAMSIAEGASPLPGTTAPSGDVPSAGEGGHTEGAPATSSVAQCRGPIAVPPNPAVRRYLTQPYTQLASVYRAIGQDEQANAVLVARAQRIGELSPILSAQGLWYRYLGRLIGYGYEPFRAIKIGLGIVLVGTVVFAVGARRNLMAETKLAEHVLSQENEPRLVSATYPRFNPLVYSLDVFLPFVDLQQICYWLPGERAGLERTSQGCLLQIGSWTLSWSAMLRTYFWFQTLAGWTLCTLLAAAVTGIVES